MENEAFQKRCCVNIKCPHCEKDIKTNVDHECGVNTWLICFFLCVLTACCCFIPLLSNKFKDIIHTCPYCKNEVGINEFEIC
ncbi:unnamed protein product [Paramecium sonneborni]|uniref:LITAF domain-containing protein n=1 Tax=Paramecium sonneborni TaxID=65129 RepID=A0A8S1LFX0_9CILI|nr:unnamed protein product [Paramecium sonneborni]